MTADFLKWKKKNLILIEQMIQFEDGFRLKNSCSCKKLVFENGKTYCKHIIGARARKFKERIKEQISFLP